MTRQSKRGQEHTSADNGASLSNTCYLSLTSCPSLTLRALLCLHIPLYTISVHHCYNVNTEQKATLYQGCENVSNHVTIMLKSFFQCQENRLKSPDPLSVVRRRGLGPQTSNRIIVSL